MTRKAWIQFSVLAAFWGASYLFIKVALEDVFSPPMIVFVRTALAALVLVPFLNREVLGQLRERVGALAVLAFVQVAAPFMLISFGEQHIPSALTGILVATAPMFTFILAIWLSREERAQGLGLVGVGLGIVGVILLLGVDAGGGSAALAGGLMVVLASLGYALGSFYLKRKLGDLEPVPVVAGAMALSALMAAPVAALDLPSEAPALDAVASLAALGILGTGISFVLLYGLISTMGATKSSLVAYVAPGFAVIYGVLLLDEKFTLVTLAGLALIVGGSWLAAEGRLPRRGGRGHTEGHRGDGVGSLHTSDAAGVMVRMAAESDAFVVGRLARLDSTLFAGGPALLAEVDGEVLAALPFDGSPAFADPFRRTADLVALLEIRLVQLRASYARAASWPQAAAMSRPRVSRTVAGTPRSSSAARNASIAPRPDPS